VLLGAGAWLASSALAPAFASVDGFVAGVWKSASARGVSRRTFEAAMGGFRPLSSVIKLTDSQAEFVSTSADYVEKRVSAARTGTGRDMRHEWAQTLAAVAHRYGVQPEAILAIWGMETNYGGYMGNTNTVHALASTGNYLSEHGWRPGETWGYEVKFPPGFNYDNVWSGRSATLAEWHALGVVRANGKAFPRPSDVATLLMPMGAHGPVFAMLPNFSVIKRYNNSNNYALAVGHLADRIIGGGGFVTPWPHDTGLSRSQRVHLQQALLRKGYDIGSADGVIGPRSRAAIMQFQRRNGLIPDGFASGNLLKALT
jgi:membrane-bound lytic murein transglycosylase B